MCYGARFAQRFVARLEEIAWSGLVLTANDVETNSGHAYESEAVNNLRWYSFPVYINRPDWTLGRGVYTSAFALGLCMLYESERVTNVPHTVSVRDFNDRILRPLCSSMSKTLSVPVIRPCVYSHSHRH